MGESKERDGLFGKYTEHYDDEGNKIGESRKREGLFGDYTEHTDADGSKIGESREREGVFGDYTEHTDDDGRKIGESREREGLFGDYTEHTDSDDRKIGESRKREGIFGKYTEHTGSGHYSGAEVQTSSDGEGIIATLANFAGKIGAGIGAIGGLVFAFDQSYGLVGYILSFIIGSSIGGAVGSIGVYLLFIGAGLFLLLAILRACGIDVDNPPLSNSSQPVRTPNVNIPSKPVQQDSIESTIVNIPSSTAVYRRFIVKREHKSFTGKSYKKGDILLVHSYRGEGYFNIEFNGETYDEDLSFSPYGGSSGTRCQEDPKHCWGELDAEFSIENK